LGAANEQKEDNVVTANGFVFLLDILQVPPEILPASLVAE